MELVCVPYKDFQGAVHRKMLSLLALAPIKYSFCGSRKLDG